MTCSMSTVTPVPPRKTTFLSPTVAMGVVGVAPAKVNAPFSTYSLVFVPVGAGMFDSSAGLVSKVVIILSASAIETVWSHHSAAPSTSLR